MIQEINSEHLLIDEWTFGGGTAMMLQIDHRESRDIDIFLADPQLLALLNPDNRDFSFEQRPSEYSGDGSKFMKLFFEGAGEIDFIVARHDRRACQTYDGGRRECLAGNDPGNYRQENPLSRITN